MNSLYWDPHSVNILLESPRNLQILKQLPEEIKVAHCKYAGKLEKVMQVPQN